MRIVTISDTHALHNRIVDLPGGDVFVHAGDLMNSGYDPRDVLSFNLWLGEQPFKHRVVCAGNHDRYFENLPQDTDVTVRRVSGVLRRSKSRPPAGS
mgnify:CR=1 FL=1